jgi:peptide deformylase
MIYDLVHYRDPILHSPIPPFDFTNPPTDPSILGQNLYETMVAHNGIGLSANQCGLPYRVFVMVAPDDKYIACFNPKIVDFSEEKLYLDEGCLSYPGLFVKIKRPKIIKVRYTQSDGETVTRKFDGMSSRCFQHELSHLDGVVHINLANTTHKEQALKKWKRANAKNKG